MANRSYIYSTNFDNSLDTEKENKKIHGISEYAYNIPLSFKILVSQEPKIVNSFIADDAELLAIQGDFQKGKQKLFNFLDDLIKEDIFEKSILEEKISKTREFFNLLEDTNNNFFVLENVEIYEMSSDDLSGENLNIFENEILKIDDFIKNSLIELRELKQKLNSIIAEQHYKGLFKRKKEEEAQKNIKNILEDMWYILGIDYWSDNLYYIPEL